jgi:RimJ/RimL family protein N-acetyltransferase
MNVSIRPFREGDQPDLVDQANNIRIYNNVRNLFPYPYTPDDAQKWVKLNKDLDPALNMAITVNDRLVGGIGVLLKDDIYCRNAEIGYFLGEKFWGKGITTEAVRQFIAYVFSTFDVNRIFAPTFDYNRGSQRVLEKNGFILEGKFRKSIYKNGRFYDEYVYSLLKEDYMV